MAKSDIQQFKNSTYIQEFSRSSFLLAEEPFHCTLNYFNGHPGHQPCGRWTPSEISSRKQFIRPPGSGIYLPQPEHTNAESWATS